MANKKPIPHTAPQHLPSATSVGSMPETNRLRVTVVVRSEELPSDHPVVAKINHNQSDEHAHTTPVTLDELGESLSPAEEHIEAVKEFGREHGLDVVEVSQLRHDVVLEGDVPQLEAAFNVKLESFEHDDGVYHGHREPVHLPEELHDIVLCVLGLDSIPIHGRPLTGESGAGKLLNVLDVGSFYGLPPDAKGAGQRIALLEFSGGYHGRDMSDFFCEMNIDPPIIRDICVDGAKNDPLDRETIKAFLGLFKQSPGKAMEKFGKKIMDQLTATLEVTMDLQIVAALAPAAEIDVYFVKGDAQSYRRGIFAALGDSQSANEGTVKQATKSTNGQPVKPATVISISYGNPEESITSSHFCGIESALDIAKKAGVTVCCASGDFGSRGTSPIETPNGKCNVCYPASSPNVLACGGTTIVCENGNPESEVVWNEERMGTRIATTGGVSGRFEMESWQKSAGVPSMKALGADKVYKDNIDAFLHDDFHGRGVPDVAASADLTTGYHVILGGEAVAGGGTSAAAPLWAALIARMNESLGHNVGRITPTLYNPKIAEKLRPIRSGDNKVTDGIPFFSAGPGVWNGCTGLGTPNGAELTDAIRTLHKNKSVSPTRN